MNTLDTVKFIENHITEMEETISLEETIATLAMDSAESWF
jgi:hypothetical protein